MSGMDDGDDTRERLLGLIADDMEAKRQARCAGCSEPNRCGNDCPDVNYGPVWVEPVETPTKPPYGSPERDAYDERERANKAERHQMCLHCELDNCSDCEDWIEDPGHGCCCGELQMSAEDIAEERLKGRDYESWADL